MFAFTSAILQLVAYILLSIVSYHLVAAAAPSYIPTWWLGMTFVILGVMFGIASKLANE